MTREEILALDNMELLNYVNSMLQQGYSMNTLEQHTGIRRQTLRDRLKKINAFYDKDVQQYVIQGEISENKKVETTIEVTKNKKGVLSPSDTQTLDSLRGAIEELTAQLIQLNDQGEAPKLQQQDFKDSKEFNIVKFEGTALNRNHKFYPQVLERLEKFKNKHSEYTLQLVINTLLWEALELYDTEE